MAIGERTPTATPHMVFDELQVNTCCKNSEVGESEECNNLHDLSRLSGSQHILSHHRIGHLFGIRLSGTTTAP